MNEFRNTYRTPRWLVVPDRHIVDSGSVASATSIQPSDRLGRPLHDLRVSVLDRCNFRCPYCMPAHLYNADFEFLRRDQLLTYDEITRIVSACAHLGVTKIRLTGGEPLLDKNIVSLVGKIRAVEGIDDIALTTNGSLLAPIAQQLHDAGLGRINISLDTIDPDVFAGMSGGRGRIDDVLDGIATAQAVGFSPVKLNVVVQRNRNDHTVLELVEYFRGTGVIVRFIEFMDVGNRNNWKLDEVVPSSQLLSEIGRRWPVRALGANYRGEVATRYEFVDGGGEIGFVSSITQPFCGSCSRARLSADGVFYSCLFATEGRNLKAMFREGIGDVELRKCLADIWSRRSDQYSMTRSSNNSDTHTLTRVEMNRVGG